MSFLFHSRPILNLLYCRYIPDATGAVYTVLKDMAHLRKSKKKRYDEEDAEILQQVSDNVITRDTLSEKLAQHVQQVSSESCLFLLDS